MQWAEPIPRELPHKPALGEELPVEMGDVTISEVRWALQQLKRGKAAGKDGVPSDFWKALLVEDAALEWAAALCQTCWQRKCIPEEWHEAIVIPIFKKGDSADANNNRPISLLAIGYKTLASIMLTRLKEAGAEARVRKSQFGFVSGKGTIDALFVARRIVETGWALADGKVMLLLLDWSTAFDKVDPAALVYVL